MSRKNDSTNPTSNNPPTEKPDYPIQLYLKAKNGKIHGIDAAPISGELRGPCPTGKHDGAEVVIDLENKKATCKKCKEKFIIYGKQLLFSGISLKEKFSPRGYTEGIVANYALKFDKHRRFWWFDDSAGIWKEGFELKLNELLRKEMLLFQHLSSANVSQILSDLEGFCYEEETPDEPDFHLIPFRNRIYDLRNEKLLDFEPQHFFINKLNVNYSPENKECPRIDEIFHQLVPKRDVITLYEILAYSMIRSYPYPKSFILYGNGANGKSTYVRIMKKVLGRDNISNTSLDMLHQSIFATSQLYGKYANISTEMSYGILRGETILKQLTGSDDVEGQKKFKDQFSFQNYAKMISLTNEVPWTKDKSFAFYRRIFLIEFPRRFEIAKGAKPFIVERLPQVEFEGLAYKCLQILKDMNQEERCFTLTRHQATDDVMKEYEKLSDPLGIFLEERTEDDPESDIPVRSLNDEFTKWQKKKGLRVWNDKLISTVMSQKGISKGTKRLSTSINGDHSNYKAYFELRWREGNEKNTDR